MTRCASMFTRSLRRMTGLFLMFWLAGCTMSPSAPPMPALDTLPAIDARSHRLTFVRNEQRNTLLGVLRHDGESLRLALLSPQGQRLLTLVRDAQGSRFLPTAAFDPPFTAQWLSSRLAWSLWPAVRLRDTFYGSDWRLDIEDGKRLIYHDTTLVARLSRTSDCRIIHDLEGDYRLYIATIDDHQRAIATCPAP